MLEADVGELPQQVVHQHEACRWPAPSGRRSRSRGCGSAAPAGGRGPEPIHRVSTPHAGRAAHRVDHRGFVGGRHRDQQVAGLTRDPRLRDGVGFDERDRGQRPLAHDHRMDELDGDVVGVRFPLR